MLIDQTTHSLETYFASYDACRPYQPDSEWEKAFHVIASRIASKIQPGSVLDAGCAYGLLVDCLRSRGIEAFGVDPNSFGIEQIPDHLRSFCWQASLFEPLPRRYDLIISLESLKRLAWPEAQAAIANLCRYTDDILFVVTPNNFRDISTRSPYPPEDWAEVFARQGFFRELEFSAESISPWAIRFRKAEKDFPSVVRDYERRVWMNSRESQDLRATISDTREELSHKEKELSQLNSQTAELLALQKEVQLLTRQVNEMSTQILDWHNHWMAIQSSRTWRMFQAFQRVQPRLAPEGSTRSKLLIWGFDTLRKITRGDLFGRRSKTEPGVSVSQSDIADQAHQNEAASVASPPVLSDAQELLKVALYSSDPWTAACVHLRAVGPASHMGSGIQVLEGMHWEPKPSLNLPDDAQVALIQRDFPRYEAYYQQVITWADATGKPILYELDDLLTELPDEHPEKDYYAAFRPLMLDAMRRADGVIVSTLALAEYARAYKSNTWVLPNYLDDRIWRVQPRSRSGKQASLVIGYMGGLTKTHLPDLELVTPILSRLLLRYGNRLRLRFWGVCPPELEGLPNVEFPAEKFPDYLQFASFFSRQDCDLFVAPLRDNLFNRSKSAIKFLEYSSLGIPGVYSRVTPYEGLVKTGWNGFLASDEKEWESSLTRLIEDAQLRQAMGNAAYQTVDENWRMSRHAHEWGTVYRAALSCIHQPAT